MAAALADRGQQVVARYGIGDLLPGDPEKLVETDFRNAERAFAAAIALVSNGVDSGRVRAELEARRLFCRGRAEAFHKDRLLSARKALFAAREAASPTISEIENALGLTYLEEGSDYGAAALHFTRAISLSPRWAYPRHNLALTYAEQGNYTAAQREYRAAIAVLPNHGYLQYNLGLLLHRSNRRKAAAEAYAGALAGFRKSADGYRERAAEWRERLPRESGTAFRRAEELRRSGAEVHNAQGALWESQGQWDLAIGEYEEALKLKPELCAARHNLAIAQQKRNGGRSAAAQAKVIHLLEENVKLCGNQFHPSLLRLATVYLAEGKRAQAEGLFQRAATAVPGNLEALVGLARIAAEEGEYATARKILTDAIGSARAHPSLHEELATLMQKMGDPAACEQFRLAVRALHGNIYQGDAKALRRKAAKAACKE
jgi:Tfp pilus assembly protein PilF